MTTDQHDALALASLVKLFSLGAFDDLICKYKLKNYWTPPAETDCYYKMVHTFTYTYNMPTEYYDFSKYNDFMADVSYDIEYNLSKESTPVTIGKYYGL